MNGYTIRVLRERRDFADKELRFIAGMAKHLSTIYKECQDTWTNFRLYKYAEAHRVTCCYYNGEPVGALLARLSPSVFDGVTMILYQDILYARPASRASKLLLEDFIDFGKRRAKYIVTMVGQQTRIKGKNLEKLGFEKIEEIYRIEV
jgi:hypothetical protein